MSSLVALFLCSSGFITSASHFLTLICVVGKWPFLSVGGTAKEMDHHGQNSLKSE